MTPTPFPVIIAHRGASFYFPENTIEAFRAAVDMRAEMVELDVRRTADGALVVRHDPEIGGRLLAEMTLVEARTAGALDGRPLATFKEAVELLAGRMPLNVEFKEYGCEEDVLALLGTRWGDDDILLSSSIDIVVRRLKELRPEARTGLIVGGRRRFGCVRDLFPSRRLRMTKADVLCANRRLLPWGLLRRAGKVPVYVYTVNDRRELWKIITDGRIAGIFTDRPDVALFLRDLWRVKHEGERKHEGKRAKP